jgi:phosphoglycolate phosphatase
MKNINSVLFDLDGTLLDTVHDLACALNIVLTRHQRPVLSVEKIRPIAGHGYRAMLKLAELNESAGQQILEEYQKHLLDSTCLFPGMDDVLTYLDDQHIPWGIVTNKPERFTLKIVNGLQLSHRASCVISGDSLKNSKPHPEPILHACKLMQREPKNCLFVGDAKIDILASIAAGTASLVALYGYIPDGENPETWGATGMIQHPSEIIGLLA